MTGFTQADIVVSFLEGRNDLTLNGFSFGTPATQLNIGELQRAEEFMNLYFIEDVTILS